jgi:hypothetical protein
MQDSLEREKRMGAFCNCRMDLELYWLWNVLFWCFKMLKISFIDVSFLTKGKLFRVIPESACLSTFCVATWIPRTEWLIHSRHLFLTVLEAGKAMVTGLHWQGPSCYSSYGVRQKGQESTWERREKGEATLIIIAAIGHWWLSWLITF